MKITVDVHQLQREGLICADTAALLERHAIRSTGSTAINMLIAFGVAVLAAGALALLPSPWFAAFFGLCFAALGLLVLHKYGTQWDKLGAVWCILGALLLAGSFGYLIGQPLLASLLAALIFTGLGWVAKSKFLAALVPLSLASALGGSTGYWHACYAITVQEPTLTIGLFALLGWAGWRRAQVDTAQRDLWIVFARICVILVNFGFWIGSLWGDDMGETWGWHVLEAHPLLFIIGWAVALLAAGIWGARRGRRFMVNTAAVFGSIHAYTQWFELLGGSPFTVMVAGGATVAIGLALWRYNRRAIEAKRA